MRKLLFWFCAVFAAFLIVISLVGPNYYKQKVITEAKRIVKDDFACFFDGFYGQSGMPLARFSSTGQLDFQFLQDIRNRFMNDEGAKPFHFGIVVLRKTDSDAPSFEAWGWSYRRGTFWQSGNGLRDTNDEFIATYIESNPARDCMRILGELLQ